MKKNILSGWLIAMLLVFNYHASAQDINKSPVREDKEWLDIWLPHSNENNLPRVLLIGNSITRAYSPEVEQLLNGKAYIARLATSKSIGDPDLLPEIEMIMKYHHFDVVHFNNGLHGVGYTEKEYAEAFPAFFYTIKKNAPNAVLIWASTTPIREGKNMEAFSARVPRIKERNRIAADFLKDKNLITNDLFNFLIDKPIYFVGGDGVHLAKIGTTALAQKVATVIEESLTKINKQN